MAHITLGQLLLKELESEAAASRKCLERIPSDLFDYKPHEKSMAMGRLALIVAEIPRWISTTIDVGEINFGTFKHIEPKNAADLVKQFDENMAGARKSLEGVSDGELENGMFYLKMGDKELMSGTKLDTVMQTINHSVHHRGQLTVYLRLKNIPVPSVYGPSGDEGGF